MATILVIDDEVSIQRLIHEALVLDGYEVLDAADAASGLKLLDSHTVDLVITDIMMPDQDGLELIQQLRQDRPGLRIIAISGGGRSAWSGGLDVARWFGAFRTLEKPFRLDALLSIVREALTEAA